MEDVVLAGWSVEETMTFVMTGGANPPA